MTVNREIESEAPEVLKDQITFKHFFQISILHFCCFREYLQSKSVLQSYYVKVCVLEPVCYIFLLLTDPCLHFRCLDASIAP